MRYEYDITINVTAHNEGTYLQKTLRSVDACVSYARTRGLDKIEVNLGLDNADPHTESIAQQFVDRIPNAVIHRNAFGDLSHSRNYLIEASSGKYIMFFDGDDLFFENFVYEAFLQAEGAAEPRVYSAHYVASFADGVDPNLLEMESTTDNPHRKTTMFVANPFASQNFVHSEIYRNVRYLSLGDDYGFEDWHWNTRVVAAGYEFQIVPGTIHFYRRKPGAASMLNRQSGAAILPTSLFQPQTFRDFACRPVADSGPNGSSTAVDVVKQTAKRVRDRLDNQGIAFRALRLPYRAARKIRAAMRSSVPDHVNPLVLDDEQVRHWRNLARIEPLIRPADELVDRLTSFTYSDENDLVSGYHELCRRYGDQGFDDLILVPWIRMGGADLAMIDLAAQIGRCGRRPLVIATLDAESTWTDRLEEVQAVGFLQRHVELAGLTDEQVCLFILRVVQNWNIRTVTIMNSEIGFEAVASFRGVLGREAEIVVHSYATPIDQNGLPIEAFPAFSRALPHFDAIVTDSEAQIAFLHETYGIPSNIMHKVHLKTTEGLRNKESEPTFRILYANRIAREKQPEIAIEVAERLQPLGVEMEMFGERDPHFCREIDFDGRVERVPNVTYRGKFNGVESLDFDEYDICFVPSIYEGIPRIVLDAIKANLFIVCARVGGLTEVVTDGQNGLVVDDPRSVDDYVERIAEYYRSPKLQDLEQRRIHTKELLDKHSERAYLARINSLYGLDGR